MKWAGKMLELIGMVVVAAGLLYGIGMSLIKFELTALAVGSMVFLAGWLLEKQA